MFSDKTPGQQEQNSNLFEDTLREIGIVSGKITLNDVLKVIIFRYQKIETLLQTQHRQAIEHTPLEEWVDGQYVMQLLHLSLRTLQDIRDRGILPFSRIGNKLYYRLQDIRKILADNYIMYNLSNRKNTPA